MDGDGCEATILHSSWQHCDGTLALAEAGSLHTMPQRLSELSHFEGLQFNDELDNRLATNRNTPVETLRTLAGRTDQLYTQQLLAENPRTPQDIRSGLRRRPVPDCAAGNNRRPLDRPARPSPVASGAVRE